VFIFYRTFIAISFSCVALLLPLSARASGDHDSHGSQAATSASPSSEDVSEFDKPSEARKLYRRYKKNYDKMIVAVACVRSPKCILPEDEALRYSEETLKTLQKLDQLAAEKDIPANYYRGLIAFERGTYYDQQANQVTHPDFILTATVMRRYALDQFRIAEKMMQIPAKEKAPDACRYLGEMYSHGSLGYFNTEKATSNYYCAAMSYIDEGRKIKAAQAYNAMKVLAIPNEPRVIEVYARLHNEEPVVPWRKLPDSIAKKSTKTSAH